MRSTKDHTPYLLVVCGINRPSPTRRYFLRIWHVPFLLWRDTINSSTKSMNLSRTTGYPLSSHWTSLSLIRRRFLSKSALEIRCCKGLSHCFDFNHLTETNNSPSLPLLFGTRMLNSPREPRYDPSKASKAPPTAGAAAVPFSLISPSLFCFFFYEPCV